QSRSHSRGWEGRPPRHTASRTPIVTPTTPLLIEASRYGPERARPWMPVDRAVPGLSPGPFRGALERCEAEVEQRTGRPRVARLPAGPVGRQGGVVELGARPFGVDELLERVEAAAIGDLLGDRGARPRLPLAVGERDTGEQ